MSSEGSRDRTGDELFRALALLTDTSSIVSTTEASIKDAVADTIKRPGSLVHEYLTDSVYRRMTNEIYRDSEPIVIEYVLTDTEKVALAKSYTEFNITFKNKKVHTHAFAASSRKLEERLMFKNMEYSKLKYPSNRSFLVNDIGANWAKHINNSRYNIHSCSPIITSKDAIRNCRMNSMIRSKRDVVIKNPGLYCTQLAQDCPVRSQYLMFLHSVYDLNEDTIVEIFEKKG